MLQKDQLKSFWEFPGWGEASKINDLAVEAPIPLDKKNEKKGLGVWASTAICGNDITSSCLYVSALCAAQAGVLAPFILVFVAFVLFLFRKIYAEVGGALPLNGGTYTLLLNTTNKKFAAAAACLTLLSYMATAVISAGEAMHYAHNLWSHIDVFNATFGLLGFFAILNMIGIGESAVVALVIFVFHMATMLVLILLSSVTIFYSPELLFQNWAMPTSDGLFKALIFGFSSAMLGISGFESSANFIEEQKKGVFPLTLRNMWIAVAIINPLLSFLSFGLIPLDKIKEVPPDLLAMMGNVAWGPFFRSWISLDAFLVLSGAVLTSYVGVTGLIRRMSIDRCLPDFFLIENKTRKTNHWIIIFFFIVCCSVFLVTRGEVTRLAGVYALSFLAVMALFAIGNILLKIKRAELPAPVRASWLAVNFALVSVLVGFVGNIFLDVGNFEVFQIYFLVAIGFVAVMFLRVHILKTILYFTEIVVERFLKVNQWFMDIIKAVMKDISSQPVIYFTKGAAPDQLNKAALYVLSNEQTSHLIVVIMYQEEKLIPAQLAQHLSDIDHLYPQLKIDLLAVQGDFSPQSIEAISKRLHVPKNRMFIGTPGNRFPHEISELGGVRLIM